MKLNIAIFDKDKAYTERLLRMFQANYAGQIAISVFSDEEIFLEKLKNQYYVYIISSNEGPEFLGKIPGNIPVAFLVPDNSIGEVAGHPAVGKYQSIDAIYRRIMELCAKKVPETKMSFGGKRAKTVLFTSLQGGSGTTSCAAAFAVNLASRGKKVFFLDLNTVTASSRIFGEDERGSFSDVIFAMKSTEENFQLLLESLKHTDSSGVGFFSKCQRAQDMLELEDKDVAELVETLQQAEHCDYLIIDYSSDFSTREKLLLGELTDTVVYVSDLSENGRYAFSQFCELARFVEKREKCTILEKSALLYNKYDGNNGEVRQDLPVMVWGAVPAVNGADNRERVSVMSYCGEFNGV